MAHFRPRLTTLEVAFTVCVLCSVLALLCFISVRYGLYGVGPTDDLGLRKSLVYLWLATIVIAAIVGSTALIAGRGLLGLFLIVPFLLLGYILSLFSIILMTPYSRVETLEQLLGAQLAIYATGYLFWLALLKTPLPRLRGNQ